MASGMKRRGIALLASALVYASLGGDSHASWPDASLEHLIEESALVGIFWAEIVDPDAYDAQLGAVRTRVVLAAEKLFYGSWGPEHVEFLLPQGRSPDGYEEFWTDTPGFVQGQRYLVFLREGTWRTTPVVAGTRGSFRVARVGGRDVLVNEEGRGVVTFSGRAPRLTAKVSESHAELDTTRRGSREDEEAKAAEPVSARDVEPMAVTMAVLSQRIAAFRGANAVRRESGVILRDPEPMDVRPVQEGAAQ